ncbi:MAG: sixA [Verrucomicrobiales bacterium]|nr:sixA [Verrucomicrobiales bacterium]
MKFTLYVLRHGEAEEKGPQWETQDDQRPLTVEGIKNVEAAVQGLKRMDVEFDLVLSSPFVRARQTTEILVRGFDGRPRVDFTDHLTPSGDPRKLIEDIRWHRMQYCIVLVGHEPYLSKLVGELISGENGSDLTLKKGGMCKLETERLEYGRCATLKWLLTQKQLRAVGAGARESDGSKGEK